MQMSKHCLQRSWEGTKWLLLLGGQNQQLKITLKHFFLLNEVEHKKYINFICLRF